MQFFQILGYDVFNPTEFFPEYVADVGIKKGEKVDYAIIIDGKPCIFVECKSCNEDLDKHASQLFRYFAAAPVKFGILTNGIVYRFYTDLEKDNIMDLEPFVEVNLENINESGIKALMKFRKETFDKSNIYKAAEELKYSTLIKKVFEDRKLNMVNTRREFFYVTLDEIKQVVKENFDKTVEFIDFPDAEQYRTSLKMREQLLA